MTVSTRKITIDLDEIYRRQSQIEEQIELLTKEMQANEFLLNRYGKSESKNFSGKSSMMDITASKQEIAEEILKSNIGPISTETWRKLVADKGYPTSKGTWDSYASTWSRSEDSHVERVKPGFYVYIGSKKSSMTNM